MDPVRRLSRRDLLRGAALGGVAAFLAACGTQPAPPSASPSAASVAPPATGTPAPVGSPPVQPSAPPSAAPSSSPAPTLRERIAGLLVVGFRGSRLEQTPWLTTALGDLGLGGVI